MCVISTKPATYRSVATRVFVLLHETGGGGQISYAFSHRFSSHIDLVSVVDQPIQDGISQSGIADSLMPFSNG